MTLRSQMEWRMINHNILTVYPVLDWSFVNFLRIRCMSHRSAIWLHRGFDFQTDLKIVQRRIAKPKNSHFYTVTSTRVIRVGIWGVGSKAVVKRKGCQALMLVCLKRLDYSRPTLVNDVRLILFVEVSRQSFCLAKPKPYTYGYEPYDYDGSHTTAKVVLLQPIEIFCTREMAENSDSTPRRKCLVYCFTRT